MSMFPTPNGNFEDVLLRKVDPSTHKKAPAEVATAVPSEILQESINKHPQGEIVVLLAHGSDTSGNMKERIVGAQEDGQGSTDYTYYLLQLVAQQHENLAAIIDAGCSSNDFLPTDKYQIPAGVPYFATQARFDYRPSRYQQFAASSCVVLIGGVIFEYDWKTRNRRIQTEQEMRMLDKRLQFLPERSIRSIFVPQKRKESP